ncbi:rhodanese-like domain-containing protein [Patescibacteria group bacterium]
MPEVADSTNYTLPEELHRKILQSKNDLLLIDIRDSEDYQQEYIEESINIPLSALYQNYTSLSKTKKNIIIGYDFEQKDEIIEIVNFLTNKGFKNISVLSGGLYSWKEEFYPTISWGNPTSFEDRTKVNYIQPEQLKLAIENNYSVFIVDARPEFLFNQGHIPGAHNIPIEQIESRKHEIPRAKEIVVYTENETRDFQVNVRLVDLNFLATYSIKGGLSTWQEKRFPIEKQ